MFCDTLYALFVGCLLVQHADNDRERAISRHAIAYSSSDIGRRFRLESLKSFGSNLTDGVNNLRNKHRLELKRRDLKDDLSGAFRDLTGGAVSIGGLNMTGGLTGVLGSLGDLMVGSLGTPALFLGIGLGYVCVQIVE